MGWTSTYQKFSSKLDAACALEGFKPERVVASNVDKSGVYLAYRLDDGRVIGCVCLIETKKENGQIETAAKAISETSVPFHYGASAKVLAALSPTTDENALLWREECHKRASRKASITVGDTFKVKVGMPFKGDRCIAIGEVARVCEVKRTKIVMHAPAFGLFTLTVDQLENYMRPADEVVEAAPPKPAPRAVTTVAEALEVLADADAEQASIDAALALLA